MASRPVRSPSSRPALPRASSATSGFFFWGSIDEPVAQASSSATKPNSVDDHSTSSSPSRDRCTPHQGHGEERLGHEVAVATASRLLSNRAGEAEVRGDQGSGSRGSDVPASAPAPSGLDRRPAPGVEEAVASRPSAQT